MSATTAYLAHPLADLIPAMSDDEYARLRDDIAANGLLDVITLHESQVLDGRHRLRACEETGTEPRFVEYEGDSPAQFVISHNLARRHLSKSQLAMIAVDFLPELEKEAKKRSGARNDLHKTSVPIGTDENGSASSDHPSAELAGAAVGVSGRSVARAKRIAEESPDLAEAVRTGEMAVTAAEEALLDESVQPRVRRDSAAVREREQRITELAEQGHSSSQMARDLGLSEKGVRAIISRIGINVPADIALGRSRYIDANRVVEETVLALDAQAGSTNSLLEGRWNEVDRGRAKEWLTSAKHSLKEINLFVKQLEEVSHDAV